MPQHASAAWSRVDRRTACARLAGLRALLAALSASAALGACGGGGGGASGPVAPAAAPASQSAASSGSGLSAREQQISEQIYAGSPRTPIGFRLDADPVGVSGPVQTQHLKNADVASVPSTSPRFELCTDDVAQATAWSEARAAATTPYADLVESNSDARMFELVRVPRNDATARVRHRVFRCAHLDRAGTDLAADTGTAGLLRARSAGGDALQALGEYLWQFTLFNNADHVVLSSAIAAGPGGASWVHGLDLARLTRAGSTGGCDRIDLLRWTHTLDNASGALTRRLETLQSFGARRSGGAVLACSP